MPMVRIILHKHELGDLGEKSAIDIVFRPQNGFVNVRNFVNARNLNAKHPNYSYVALYTEWGGKKYVISVKTRREYSTEGETVYLTPDAAFEVLD